MPDRLDVTSQVFNTAQHPDLFRPTVARVGVTRWLPRAASHHERTCGVGWWSVPRVAISRKLMTTSHGISRLRTLVMPVRAIAQVALALAPLGGSSVDVCVEQLCGTADRRSTGGDQTGASSDAAPTQCMYMYCSPFALASHVSVVGSATTRDAAACVVTDGCFQ
ncbi:hypothetical protein PINS_up020927 [Pythium insidiosum]|nr:hypothetical protein PINS_up020927 [Pythium insidiosum]